MSSGIKSLLVSLLAHSAALAALVMLDADIVRRFQVDGSKDVLAMQASMGPPSMVTPPMPMEFSETHRRVPISEHWGEAQWEPMESEVAARRRDLSMNPRRDFAQLEANQDRDPMRPEIEKMPREASPRGMPENERPPELELRPKVVIVTPPVIPANVPMPTGLNQSRSVDLRGNPPPVYPTEAIANRWEGVVSLAISVSAAGEVTSVRIKSSSGYPVLDEAAREAVLRWRGEPAERWGRPVESREVLPIRFRL